MFFLIVELKLEFLGGSLNPAHYGHIHLSSIALKKVKIGRNMVVSIPSK